MELTVDQALQQGVAAHNEGKLQDAERLYRAILQSQPLHPDANHNLGVLAVSVNKADAALPLFKTALEANPKIEQFWLSYIDALIKEQQFDNAKQVLEQAKKQGVAVDKLNNIETQPAPEIQTENVDSVSPSQRLLNSLLESYQNGLHDDAEKLALSIAEKFPRHNFSWKILAEIFKKTGRTPEALDAGQKAIEIDPTNSNAIRTLATLYYDLGDKEKSVETFQAAIKMETDKKLKANLYFNLGVLNMQLNNFQDAEDSFLDAYDLNPDDTEALIGIAQTFENAEKWRRASKFYRELITLEPENPAHYKGMARVLMKQGDPEGATRYFEKAKKLGG